jgi:hypothetical protein
MPKKPLETPLEQARRHVAEAEARVARQHEILRLIDADRHPDVATTMQQVLVTMETTLSAMHAHLNLEEQRHAGS